MNKTIEKMTGMDTLTDEVIAGDLLQACKAGIRLTAQAITETTTYEARIMLQEHLDEAIGMHEAISNYMKNNEMYHPYHLDEQIRLSLENANDALDIE